MKEVVSLFIGQAGVQIGTSLWELLCAEHAVTESGTLLEKPLDIECVETFFGATGGMKYVPRALFIDLEPTCIDEIRQGVFRKLFHPDRLITGPEDAASNFARGFFTVGKLLLGSINNEARRLLENTDCIQGIFLFRSLGGGTGAGLTSAIFDGLAEYPKITKVEVPVYPSPTLSSSMVEPYNCLLGEHFCMEDVDVGLLIDNEAIYDVCTKYLTVSYPTFHTINRLIAQLASCITASVRFESVLACDITVLQTNLVPYPRIHFPLANFAPVLSPDKAQHEELSVMDLTRYVFERENQMMKVDHSFGRFMSCSLFYRGNVSPYHVYQALSEIKRDKSIEFVDWCPTGFKIGINICPPTSIPNSGLAQTSKNVTMLTNTSAIGQAWQRLTHKFYLLYSKRSFVHWFVGEGMEECEFTESLYNISALVKDYEEAAMDTKFETNEEGGIDGGIAQNYTEANQAHSKDYENTTSRDNPINNSGSRDFNTSASRDRFNNAQTREEFEVTTSMTKEKSRSGHSNGSPPKNQSSFDDTGLQEEKSADLTDENKAAQSKGSKDSKISKTSKESSGKPFKDSQESRASKVALDSYPRITKTENQNNGQNNNKGLTYEDVSEDEDDDIEDIDDDNNDEVEDEEMDELMGLGGADSTFNQQDKLDLFRALNCNSSTTTSDF